jgi:hypothetical protein
VHAAYYRIRASQQVAQSNWHLSAKLRTADKCLAVRCKKMTSLDDVYLKFGETAEAAQLLETELGNILLLIEGSEKGLLEKKDKELARTILKKIERSTLGRLLKSVEKKIGGFEAVENIFERAWYERNRLSHSFYREHNFRRNTPKGCQIMLEDLKKTHETILGAYTIALALSGVDIESLEIPLPIDHLPIWSKCT